MKLLIAFFALQRAQSIGDMCMSDIKVGRSPVASLSLVYQGAPEMVSGVSFAYRSEGQLAAERQISRALSGKRNPQFTHVLRLVAAQVLTDPEWGAHMMDAREVPGLCDVLNRIFTTPTEDIESRMVSAGVLANIDTNGKRVERALRFLGEQSSGAARAVLAHHKSLSKLTKYRNRPLDWRELEMIR